MRLIWVKVGGLWPVNTGGRIRSFHMLRELSRRHHVSLLTTHAPSEDPQALAAALPECEVVSVPWALAKRDEDANRLTSVLAESAAAVRIAAVLLLPVMPTSPPSAPWRRCGRGCGACARSRGPSRG